MLATEERRSVALANAGVQIRAAADGAAERFTGLASPFGSRAAIGNPKTWGFFEEFAPGCYTDTLTEEDQRFLIDHDSYYVVSRVSAGSLTLAENISQGLLVDSALDPDLTYVGDLKTNIRNGNITGMSIGFMVPAGGDQWSTIDVEEPLDDGRVQVYQADLRTITQVDLIEVSAVTFPAFVDTQASLRYAIMPALALRGSREAIEKRAVHRPEIGELLAALGERRELKEPAVARQPLAERMNAYRARYPRLRG